MAEHDKRTFGDPLHERLRAAYEPDRATVERVKTRARLGRRDDPGESRAGVLVPRLAFAALLSILAIVVWRIPQPPTTPVPIETAEKPTLVISNESGLVTVSNGGSQWIVLPGDQS